MRFDEAGEPGAELPVDVVLGRLREVFGDDPELDLPIADGDIVELEFTGARASIDGFVYAGAQGVQRVVVEFTDRSWGEPVHEFRQEITPALDALVALAVETGARLFDTLDPQSSNLTTARALDLLAPPNPPDVG
ncbi:hypothetical protein Q2K19_08925 [Micromonospora soli]|uniref:hypothetical protein n=1 Tax=Micromonospora sp. NBRC 110009 TaxID=3061627 RepID=UPI002672A310|nr:hypothetical protein [Micromonospora sp. NBRC 110009]WKU00584.1 hypothetical protein Q2K19_08925 [Micromonospora sp. NBRC 110009]